ncbi:MAG: hypothetical protein V2A62_04275 [Candidatus Woesearchaeota archaeon]
MVVFSVEKELIDDVEEGSPSSEEDISGSLYIDDYVRNDSSTESNQFYESLLPTDSTHLERILTYTGMDTSNLLSNLDEEEGYLIHGLLADPYTQEAYRPVEAEGNQKSEPQKDIISYCIRRALDLSPSLCPEVEDSIDMVREDDEDMGRVFRHRFYAIYASTFGAEFAIYRSIPVS